MPFDIVAFGFNALGQLLPLDCAWSPSKLQPTEGFINDLATPTIVAKAKSSVRILFAGWSDTLLEIDGILYLRGAGALQRDIIIDLQDDLKIMLLMAFGDHIHMKGVLVHKHELLSLSHHPDNPNEVCFITSTLGMKDILKIAIAGNGKVCIVRGLNKISLYKSYEKLVTQQVPEEEWDFSDIAEEVVDVKSNETAFTILTAIGTVYTFGDPRHDHLGRDLESAPSTKPGLVDALDGIRIAKISSGGWITAALSAERDLYIWGGRSGGEEQIQGLKGLRPDSVDLVDLGGGLDVISVSVGAGHLAAVTADGRVWTVGRNDNGQTGTQTRSFQSEWKELHGVSGAGKAVEVVCGGWGTFIVFEQL